MSNFAVPWTVSGQVPLSMEFSMQEHWSGLPFPTLGDLPDLGIKLESLASPALAGRFLTTAPPGKPQHTNRHTQIHIIKNQKQKHPLTSQRNKNK